MAKNIVLLSTPSRESRSKQRHYAQAAAEIGLDVRSYPDRHTVAVVACSDYLAVDAAWLAKRHGIPGPDPIAATIATHKSLAYQFMASHGLPTLFWQVPLSDKDLSQPFDRPVIVKPDRGSGSFSRHSWSYRAFPSMRAFRSYLVRHRLLDRFVRYQRNPSFWAGRYIVMEYVPGELHGVACVIGDAGAIPYDYHSMRTLPGSMVVDRILFGRRHPDARSMVRVANAFAAAGLRRSILYLQCIERHRRLYAIDVNLRPGTLFELAASRLGLPFYRQALSMLVGRDADMRLRWPGRFVGVRRMPIPLRHGTRRVAFPGGAIPLVDKVSFNPARPYDFGHSWPVFAVRCSGWRDFERRGARVISRTRIMRTGTSAQASA